MEEKCSEVRLLGSEEWGGVGEREGMIVHHHTHVLR